MNRIRIALLGATGSIGSAALAIAREFPDRVELASLAAGVNDGALIAAAREFGVRRIALADPEAAARARAAFDGEVGSGADAIQALAARDDADVVVNALVGSVGLPVTVAALRAGKRVALANKESVVLAGALLAGLVAEHGGEILPVDSEHSGLHQVLDGHAPEGVRRVTLTASGGPFRERDPRSLGDVTPEEVLRHPTWSMGARITVDSATLLNKGFEVLEAQWLFGLRSDQLDVVIHPQSIVHALVEFVDGSVVAQLSSPDMRLPLLYAISHPGRWTSALPRLDLAAVGSLTFERPDPARAPGLAVARRAMEAGGTAPAVLNAADEEAVRLFLAGRIRFVDLMPLVGQVLDAHRGGRELTLQAIWEADRWARARLHEAAAARGSA